MKKSLITLIALFLVFTFAACEILDMPLSAPTEDEITDSSTSPESSKETGQSETELKTEAKTEEETYPDGSHKECAFCGLCDGGGRWFIGKVMENHLIMPLGTNCFEKNAAGDAGIDVWYTKVDGEERRLEAGEYVCVMYGGYIMESYPVQINSTEVRTVDINFHEDTYKNLSDYLVDYGDYPVKIGNSNIYPIEGFVCSEESYYDKELGQEVSACGDGAGVSFYLQAILNGEFTDKDMPSVTVSEGMTFNIAYGSPSVKYYNAESKDGVETTFDEIASLPNGEYYVTFTVTSSISNGRACYEYIFKVCVTNDAPKIGDYVIVDMDTDRVYLEMPISKIKILLDEDEVSWLNLADASLLIKADENLTGGNNEFDGALWLTNENGRIYLNSEIIVDKPVEEEDATVAGCLGHEHIFDKYCIS